VQIFEKIQLLYRGERNPEDSIGENAEILLDRDRVLLINRKDYEPFLADVVFAFDGLKSFGFT